MCASVLPARAEGQPPHPAPPAPPVAPDVPGAVPSEPPPLPGVAPAPKVIIPPPAPLPPSAESQIEPSSDGLNAREAKKKRKGDAAAASDDDVESSATTAMTVGARLMMGFEHQSERPAGAQTDLAQKEYGFTIRQIRLNLKGELAERFRANVSFDLADALEPEAGADYAQPPYLRTATLEYRPSRELRLKVGRFKRPLSHLELESASDLPILRRGLWNGLALEDNEWGDRAIGVMVQGRLKEPKLRWYLSLTNPNWSSTLATEGMDVTVRAEWTIVKGVVLAANGAYKNIEIGNDRLNEVAYGGDIALSLGAANLLLEANEAALPFEIDRPRGRGVLFMFDYELPLTRQWSLQPVMFAEYADANTEVSQNESLRFVLGLNVLAYSGFRIMPQLEMVRSIGDTSAQNPWLESERLSLIFSLVL